MGTRNTIKIVIATVTITIYYRYQLPPDKGVTSKAQVELISAADALREEGNLLRNNEPTMAAVQEEIKLQQSWFSNNVVDHRCVCFRFRIMCDSWCMLYLLTFL